MNILIPMAGAGSRFYKSRFKQIKPLIDIHGKPMVVRAIESLELMGKYIFVLRNFEGYQELQNTLETSFPGCKILISYTQTEGPACTALLARKHIENSESLVIANCDQIMWWSGRQFWDYCISAELDGVVATLTSSDLQKSYVKMNRSGLAIQFREKEAISDIALVGIHQWARGEDFVHSAEEMIRNDDRAPNGEFYISHSYNWLIKAGKKVGIYHLPNFMYNSTGTPEELELYLKRVDESI